MSTVAKSQARVQPPSFNEQFSLHRLTVAQYLRMVELGILTTEDRVELLEGWIIDKMTQNAPHAAAITRMQRRLVPEIGEAWLIRAQGPIGLADSLPEPDLAVVPGPEEAYFTRHPTARDVALVIEVADTTLQLDRQLKVRLYARARIPVYWIANLVDFTIEVHTRPRSGRTPVYRQRQVVSLDEAVPLVLAGKDLGSIAVRELLPVTSA